MKLRWLLLWLSVCGVCGACAAQPVSAAWLGVCDSAAAERSGRVLAEYTSPQGMSTRLIVRATPIPGCAAVELPVAADRVLAGGLVSPGLAAALAPGFALIGRAGDEGLQVGEIAQPDERSALTRVAAGLELSGELSVSIFGVEGRAAVRRESQHIVLECGAGSEAAGMLMRLPYRGVPRGIALAVSLAYTADREFRWGLSDASLAARGEPLPLPALTAATATNQVALPAKGFDPDSVESFTIVCPPEAARFELRSFRLEPKDAPPVRMASRALWAWDPNLWMQAPGALLDRLARAAADTVFMTVPLAADQAMVAQHGALRAFVEAAGRRGVRVWAVVGDPGAVIESERASFARFPAAYSRYNSAVPAEARLAGIQYDVEPYLNAAYALDAVPWNEAYLATMLQLRRAADLPVDIAVPFWWADQQTPGGPLIDRLAAVADSVTVMDYHTSPALIKRFAQPFLEWGVRHARAVRIALESGPIADSPQIVYRPAAAGEVALVAIGAHRVLLRFDHALPLAGFSQAMQTYAASHTVTIPGSRTTFAGRRDELLALLPELERLWSAWPAFAGVALHEFEP